MHPPVETQAHTGILRNRRRRDTETVVRARFHQSIVDRLDKTRDAPRARPTKRVRGRRYTTCAFHRIGPSSIGNTFTTVSNPSNSVVGGWSGQGSEGAG